VEGKRDVANERGIRKRRGRSARRPDGAALRGRGAAGPTPAPKQEEPPQPAPRGDVASPPASAPVGQPTEPGGTYLRSRPAKGSRARSISPLSAGSREASRSSESSSARRSAGRGGPVPGDPGDDRRIRSRRALAKASAPAGASRETANDGISASVPVPPPATAVDGSCRAANPSSTAAPFEREGAALELAQGSREHPVERISPSRPARCSSSVAASAASASLSGRTARARGWRRAGRRSPPSDENAGLRPAERLVAEKQTRAAPASIASSGTGSSDRPGAARWRGVAAPASKTSGRSARSRGRRAPRATPPR